MGNGRKAGSSTQTIRALQIVEMLASRHFGMAIDDLADELGVSSRTVDRDIQAISNVVGVVRCSCGGRRGARFRPQRDPWTGLGCGDGGRPGGPGGRG